MNKLQICFLTLRPPHKSHEVFARSIYARKISILKKGGSRYKGLLFGGIKINKLLNYDIIFAESVDLTPFLYIIKKIAPSKKIITLAMEPIFHPIYYDISPIVRKIILTLLGKTVDGIIAVSKYMESLVKSLFPEMPTGVAYPPITSLPKEKTTLKEKNILFIGHNRKSKGYLELIEAFKILKEKYKDIKLYLVGNCYKDIRGKTVDGIFVEGRVPNLNPYFKKCSLYVHPAYIDPCPVSVSEAMYAGLLTIITRNVGQAELLEKNNMSEYIIEDNTPEIIAQKIEEVLEKPISRKKRDSSMFRKIGKSLTKKYCVERFRRTFFKLINEK